MGVHSHIFLGLGLLVLAYPLCINAVAFPQSYGLHQVDRTSQPLSTAYRLNSINRTSFHKDFVFGAASSAYQVNYFIYM